ncbi:MAG TPA: NAD(P)H-quinone oxidoreductase [Propionibacteriaceae bacterium]|nr:NAD(P)H-quinone oxidoreductase [Propionibacteriaceae bacterium]
MRAVVVTEPGGPQQLTIAEVPDPVPGPGELLIRVVAAGVNRADLLQRQGFYPPPAGISDVIGLEVSGHVEALGEGVAGWSPGDEVVALLAGGGYAELAVVPAAHCCRPPRGMDLVTAGGLIEVAATVVSNLEHVGYRGGESVLVHGGTGGIGAFAIQYVTARGGRVLATAGTAQKLDTCRALGADVAIDYHEDWAAAVSEATGGAGVDVILDVVGAKYLEPNVASLARNGRLVVIGLQGGRRGTLDLNALLRKNALVTATTLRFSPTERKADIVAMVARDVWPLYEAGTIAPPAETRFPLEDARQAHEWLESGAASGKAVLVV